MSEEFLLRVAAKAVIVYNDKVLVLREANTYVEGSQIGKYGLPGGRINSNEPFFKALEREVQEETGLKIEPQEPVLIGEWWPEIKGTKNHIVAMFVKCKTDSNHVELSDEHDAYEWVDANTISRFNVVQPDIEAAEKALKNNK